MKPKNRNEEPCDGNVPEKWEMPELGTRITHTAQYVCIDFRGLSSPTPLVATLKTLAQLKQDMYFKGIYPQSPLHLFPTLMEEGWKWSVISEDKDGVHLKISRSETAQ